MDRGHVVRVIHRDFVQRDIHVVSGAGTVADVVEIALPQVRPKPTVFVTVNGEVQHPGPGRQLLNRLPGGW